MGYPSSRLSWVTKLSYGVGHVQNDLCASMWFTYLLVFFEKVLEFDPTKAGVVMLVGQLADGFSTPLVGFFADRENKVDWCARYGRRKIWHLIGTILVLGSFPFIFSPCLGCQEAPSGLQLAYYSAFVIVFQFGWASVQISHLALIPDLTPKKHQRTELNSIRYSFTVLSNLSVYTVTYFILGAGSTSEEDNANSLPNVTDITAASTAGRSVDITTMGFIGYTGIGPEDDVRFRNIALVSIIIGVIFSFIFHVGVKEPSFTSASSEKASIDSETSKDKEERSSVSSIPHVAMRMLDWFKEIQFYQVALLYMATRLYVNLYQVYIPLYVDETLELAKTAVATVPFTMYFAGFLGSLVMKLINKKIGRKGTFTLGCLIGLSACLWIWFAHNSSYTEWGIYIVAALLGIGGSTLLITSLSITADLIGHNIESGATVYGFMSFFDKLSNGLIIMVIQHSYPDTGGETWYYEHVIALACGSACLLGIFTVITLIPTKIGQRGGNFNKRNHISVRKSQEKIQVVEDLKKNGISSCDVASNGQLSNQEKGKERY